MSDKPRSYTEVCYPALARGVRRCGCGQETDNTQRRAEHMRDCVERIRKKVERGAK